MPRHWRGWPRTVPAASRCVPPGRSSSEACTISSGKPVSAAASGSVAASGKATDAGLAPKPPVSESGAEAGHGEFRMVTDSPLLMPPPAPSVDVGAPEAATPAKPIARESSDA